jgi:hypothetical protein
MVIGLAWAAHVIRAQRTAPDDVCFTKEKRPATIRECVDGRAKFNWNF